MPALETQLVWQDHVSLRTHFRIMALCALFSTISGCVVLERGNNRHLQPIPAALLSEMSAKGMSAADPIMIRIHKKESELELWKRDKSGQYALLKTYPMCRWSGQLGPKVREGDRQAPEGFYAVNASQLNPRSQFYLSFNLGFPNALEASQGYTGSALMVHGACTSAGCFAMTDQGIREIYSVARDALAGGQASFQVQALPFRMTAENMARHRESPHTAFWKNLKEGVDQFEATRQPPRVAACENRYVFNAKDGASLIPGKACGKVEPDPDIAPLVAQYQASQAEKFATTGSSIASTNYRLADGGMHPSFRRVLKSVGPQGLQVATSGDVEISRPDAALADLYEEDR